MSNILNTLKHKLHDQKDHKKIIEGVKKGTIKITNLGIGYLNNLSIMISLVTIDGMHLQYATSDLQDNKELVLAAIKQNGEAIEFASKRWKDDADIVNMAMYNAIHSLQYASDRLLSDYDFMMNAVNINGKALQYASYELQNNKDIVICATNSDIEAINLQYASDEIKDNIEVVRLIMKQHALAFNYASDRLRHDKTLAFEAFSKRLHLHVFVSLVPELKNDMDFKLSVAYDHLCRDKRYQESLPYIVGKSEELNFLLNNQVPTQDWPIIKEALVHYSKEFLNPPSIITDLINELPGSPIYNKTLALYVINRHVLNNMPTVELPELEVSL